MSNQESNADGRRLPYSVWPAQALRQLEREGADALGITLYELMQRAGQAAFALHSSSGHRRSTG